MRRTSFGIGAVVIAVLVVFILATSGPVAAKPKQTGGNQASNKCGDRLSKCLDNCDLAKRLGFGGDYEGCKGRCGIAAVNCLDKPDIYGVQPTNPTGPPFKGAGGLNPVTGGTQPPVGDGGSKPPKRPIGVNPVGPINPVKVEQPGSGSGSGVTLYDKSGSEKSFTTTHPSGFNTIKENDWPTASGSSSFNQMQHHGRHR
jgi:hypothetical protein